MSNVKISNLTEDTTPASDDLLMTVDTSASASKKVQLVNLMKQFLSPGIIVPFGGSSAPTNWLLCNGALVSRATYANLFAVIGTTYGAGDGSTTFALPDLRQRFPLGKAASGTGSTLGSSGGEIDHTHGLDTVTAIARIAMVADSGASTIHMNRRTGLTAWTATHDNATSLAFNGSSTSKTSGATLQGDTDTENPPYLVVNYIIKT